MSHGQNSGSHRRLRQLGAQYHLKFGNFRFSQRTFGNDVECATQREHKHVRCLAISATFGPLFLRRYQATAGARADGREGDSAIAGLDFEMLRFRPAPTGQRFADESKQESLAEQISETDEEAKT